MAKQQREEFISFDSWRRARFPVATAHDDRQRKERREDKSVQSGTTLADRSIDSLVGQTRKAKLKK
jgi:hypothetical protein